MTVYITKYALTKGILEAEVEPCKGEPSMVRLKSHYPTYFHGEGKEWHRTLVGAEARRDEMIKAERVRLEKALQNLDSKASLPLRKFEG